MVAVSSESAAFIEVIVGVFEGVSRGAEAFV